LGLILLLLKGNTLNISTSFSALAAVSLFLTSCTGTGRPEVSADDVELELTIGRLDQDLFHASPEEMPGAALKAYAEHGEFFQIYIEDILQGSPVDDPQLPLVLNAFVTDPDWASVQLAVDSVLGDLEPQRRDMEDAFKRLHVLFPDSLIPRVVAFNSGFNFGIFPTDSVLGFGVEWFIGKDHPVIGYLAPEAFPQYVKDRMMPDMLAPSAVKGWLLVHYTRDIAGSDLLTNLVETGKVLALLDALMPGTDAHLKYAFSPEQLAWCMANEQLIWKDIVSKDQLFSKRTDDIARLMNDGPFTNGFPRESPGHIGEWIGHRMVQAYLNEHPEVSFAELLAMDDPKVILQSYKPR
jgi:hypothetical protein